MFELGLVRSSPSGFLGTTLGRGAACIYLSYILIIVLHNVILGQVTKLMIDSQTDAGAEGMTMTMTDQVRLESMDHPRSRALLNVASDQCIPGFFLRLLYHGIPLQMLCYHTS